MTEKYGFVYIWRDKKRKMYYIGSHWGTVDDGYICSSNRMRDAYRRRPEDFKRRILSKIYTDRKELFLIEDKWLKLVKNKDKYYNMNFNVFYHWASDPNVTKSVQQKLSEASTAKHQDPEYKEKFKKGREAMRGKKQSPENIEKRRLGMLKAMAEKFPNETRYVPLNRNSQEYRDVLSQKSKEMWNNRSDEERKLIGDRISQTNQGLQNRLGKKTSEETKKKIGDANRGKTTSEETKEKQRKAKLGKKQSEGQKTLHSENMKKIWADRKAGKLSMPNYSKSKNTTLILLMPTSY